MEDIVDNPKTLEISLQHNICIDYLQETPDTNMEDIVDNPKTLEISLQHKLFDVTLEEKTHTTKSEWMIELQSEIHSKIEDFTTSRWKLFDFTLEEKTHTTKKEWLIELLSKIRLMREDFTTSRWSYYYYTWYYSDPMECLLKDWTRRVQKIFNDDDYSFERITTRNERFEKFISKELRSLPRKERLKQLESLTLYYLQFLRLEDNFPTRNARLKKFVFEEVWPVPNIRLLKQMESLTWDYIKHFIQKKEKTRDDRFINILFEELRSLPSIELPQQLEPLKLAFIKYFILRKWNPDKNNGFNKIIFDETWPLPNMELQQQSKSLTLDYIKHFIQKKWISPRNDRFIKILLEELRSQPNIETSDWLKSLKWDCLKYFILKKWNSSRNDRFIKILFKELRSLPNMELPEWLESLKWDYLNYFILKEWISPRNGKFIKILLEELRSLPNIKLPKWLESLKWDCLNYFILEEWNSPRNDRFIKILLKELRSLKNIKVEELEFLKWDYEKYITLKNWNSSRNDRVMKIPFEELRSRPNMELVEWLESLTWDYDEESFQLKEEDAAPTWNDILTELTSTILGLQPLSIIAMLKRPESILLYDDEESFHLKEEDATPTWNDILTELTSSILRLQPLSIIAMLEKLESTLLYDDEESFHPEREDATPTWCNRFTKFDSEELRFLPDIKEPKSTKLFYAESSYLKRKDAVPTWNDRFTKLEFLPSFITPTTPTTQQLLKPLHPVTPPTPVGRDDEESFHSKREDATPTWSKRFKKLISFLTDIKQPKSPQSFSYFYLHCYSFFMRRPWENDVIEKSSFTNLSVPTFLMTAKVRKPLTEKTKEVNKFELLAQKVAFWSKEILLLSFFLLVSLCGYFTEKTKRGSWTKTSIAFLCLPVILCDDHILSYHHTGMYYPDEGQYHFDTVGYVNDQEIDMYSSESRVNIPKSVWMEKHEDSDYWEKQTSMRRGWEKVFKDNLMILASRFNYTRSFHTLQLSYGCALHGSDFTGYYRYGFDGKDFLIFHQDTLLWTPGMQKAEISAQRWNSDSEIGKGVKSYLTEHCKSALKKYIGYGREELEKRVVPEVIVKGQKINANIRLQCLVYGFHPRPVDVKWVRNGKDDVPSDEMSPILPHPDGTYQIKVSVEVPNKEADTYSCHVDHSSLEDVLIKKWEPDHAKIPYICVSAFALVVFLSVSVLTFVKKRQVKRQKDPETSLF